MSRICRAAVVQILAIPVEGTREWTKATLTDRMGDACASRDCEATSFTVT